MGCNTIKSYNYINMENQKALEIIKALIDESIKKGVIGNIDTAVAIAQAYDTIAKQLLDRADEQ